MAETWVEVPGWSGYEVSDGGHVRSVDRTVPHAVYGTARQAGRALPGRLTGKGYRQVTLSRSRTDQRLAFVHALVLEAFVGPRPPGLQARHLNGQPDDNRRDNLAWGTPSENAADRRQHGTHASSARTACIHGHPFTPENTYSTPDGRRQCRVCIAARDRLRRARAHG